MPPGITSKWDDLNVFARADLIAYNQIRILEEEAEHIRLLGATMK